MTRFFIILLVLLAYTMLKSLQIYPHHRSFLLGFVPFLFFLMFGWMFLYRSYPELFHSGWFYAFVVVGSLLMGIWATFVIISLPFDVAKLSMHLLRKLIQQPHDPNRREFFTQTFRLSLAGLSASMGLLGLVQVVRGPKIKSVSISHEQLPLALKNVRIVHFSDLHVGMTIQKGYVEGVVEKINALDPDLIFFTGDLADGNIADLNEHLWPLSKLKSKYGVYSVTGNHEYYWGALDQIEKCRSFGFVPLINENKMIDIDGQKLMIAGVTDPVAQQMMPEHAPNLAKSIQSDESADFKILLAHRPDTILEAEPLGFHLQFSGHTHAGQFFPFNLLLPIAHQYYHGLNQHGRAKVYVNAGTGYWGPPNRFGISSEITHITLV